MCCDQPSSRCNAGIEVDMIIKCSESRNKDEATDKEALVSVRHIGIVAHSVQVTSLHLKRVMAEPYGPRDRAHCRNA